MISSSQHLVMWHLKLLRGADLLVSVIAGQMHSEDIPGSVRLAADGAGVGETFNVRLNMLLQFTLMIGKLAAHFTVPHPVALHKNLFNLLVKLSMNLDNIIANKSSLFCVFNNYVVIVEIVGRTEVIMNLIMDNLGVAGDARKHNVISSEGSSVLAEPPYLHIARHLHEARQLVSLDLHLALVDEGHQGLHQVAGDPLHVDPGLGHIVQGKYFTMTSLFVVYCSIKLVLLSYLKNELEEASTTL